MDPRGATAKMLAASAPHQTCQAQPCAEQRPGRRFRHGINQRTRFAVAAARVEFIGEQLAAKTVLIIIAQQAAVDTELCYQR